MIELFDIGVVIGSVSAVMVVIKALLKDVLPVIVNRVKFLPNIPPKDKVKGSYMVIAVAVGILLAFTIHYDVSYFEAFGREPNAWYLRSIDHLIVGVAAGLGEKAAADLWQWGKTGFGYLDKVGGNVPIS